MTSVTNIIAPTPPPSPAQISAHGSAVSTSTTSAPLTHANTSPISPRIVDDPLAGQIIEYLNGSGQVQEQLPSATVVAYLRAGLNAEGYSPPQTKQA